VLISCGVTDSYCVCERYKTLFEKCVYVTLFDKDMWSVASACVNMYKPSVQNTIMSYV